MNVFLAFVMFLTLTLQGIGQDISRAKMVIDTLSSPYFFGRGYVNNGELKAAEYLRNSFKEIGLKSLSENYFQFFDISINVFDQDIFKSGGLVENGDFIINSDAPKLKLARRKTIFLDSNSLLNNKRLRKFNGDKHILYTTSNFIQKHPEFKQYSPRIEIIKSTKLTHSLSQNQGKKVVFYELDSKSVKLKRYKTKIDAKLVENYLTQNVVGHVKGTIFPDSFIIFSAHYDHLGGLGSKCFFPGANDNASGIAMLLELARFYSMPENRPTHSILFIAFGAEEVGLLGSKFYVNHPLVPLKQTKFVINLDLVGSGKDGLTVVNGQVFVKEFEILNKLNNEQNLFSLIKRRGKAANSDHFHFSESGVKSFFIYTMGEITAYHDIYDVSSNVTLSKFKELFLLLTLFVKNIDNSSD